MASPSRPRVKLPRRLSPGVLGESGQRSPNPAERRLNGEKEIDMSTEPRAPLRIEHEVRRRPWATDWQAGDGEDWPEWPTLAAAIEAIGTAVPGTYRVRDDAGAVLWQGQPDEARAWCESSCRLCGTRENVTKTPAATWPVWPEDWGGPLCGACRSGR